MTVGMTPIKIPIEVDLVDKISRDLTRSAAKSVDSRRQARISPSKNRGMNETSTNCLQTLKNLPFYAITFL